MTGKNKKSKSNSPEKKDHASRHVTPQIDSMDSTTEAECAEFRAPQGDKNGGMKETLPSLPSGDVFVGFEDENSADRPVNEIAQQDT